MAKMDEMNHRKKPDEKRLDQSSALCGSLGAILSKKRERHTIANLQQ